MANEIGGSSNGSDSMILHPSCGAAQVALTLTLVYLGTCVLLSCAEGCIIMTNSALSFGQPPFHHAYQASRCQMQVSNDSDFWQTIAIIAQVCPQRLFTISHCREDHL